MKEMGLPVSEQVFQALIYAHSKLGDFEYADKIMDIMTDLGLEVDHTTYIAKMKGMITNGQDLSAIKDELNRNVENGVFFDDHDYFSLIVKFCENGNVESAKAIVESFPRKTGYYQVMRNNCARLIYRYVMYRLSIRILQVNRT